MSNRRAESSQPISVVERIALILEAFKDVDTLTLAQVTQRTGLPRSSVHRLLEQLTATGWLARYEQTYELGVQAYEVGQSGLLHNRLRAGAAPVLRQLARSTGLTVHLAVLNGADMVYLDKVRGSAEVRLPTRVGSRIPAHLTAVGKAVLANLDQDQSAKLLDKPLRRTTEHSITSPKQISTEFQRIRDHGVARDRGESVAGVGCVAAPIGPPDHYYGNMAAVSVTGPVGDIDVKRLVGPVRTAARTAWDICVAAHLGKETDSALDLVDQRVRHRV